MKDNRSEIITVIHGRGGSGATTIAMGIAKELQKISKTKSSKKILLLDWDFEDGQLGDILKLQEKNEFGIGFNKELKVDVLPIEQLQKDRSLEELRPLLEDFKRTYDYIIIDTSSTVASNEKLFSFLLSESSKIVLVGRIIHTWSVPDFQNFIRCHMMAALPKTLIVLNSVMADKSQLENALGGEFDNFLTIPFSRKRFERSIRTFLKDEEVEKSFQELASEIINESQDY